MRIIYNKYFPFGNFFAINILGVVFARKDMGELRDIDRNHELIHSLQQREMLFIGFYLWYGLEWLVRLARCLNAMQAYRSISFEQEAYAEQHDLDYSTHRSCYAWAKYLRKLS